MTTLGDMYKKLGEHLVEGRTEEARAYLVSELPNMPDDMKGEVLLELLIDSTQNEVARRNAIAHVQEQAVQAAGALLEARDELSNESH